MKIIIGVVIVITVVVVLGILLYFAVSTWRIYNTLRDKASNTNTPRDEASNANTPRDEASNTIKRFLSIKHKDV